MPVRKYRCRALDDAGLVATRVHHVPEEKEIHHEEHRNENVMRPIDSFLTYDLALDVQHATVLTLVRRHPRLVVTLLLETAVDERVRLATWVRPLSFLLPAASFSKRAVVAHAVELRREAALRHALEADVGVRLPRGVLVCVGTEELGRVRDIIAVLRRAAEEVAAAVFEGVDGARALPFLFGAFPVVPPLGEHDARDDASDGGGQKSQKHERDDASMAFQLLE